MAQKVTVLSAKPEDSSSIPGSHMVEGELAPTGSQAVRQPPHKCHGMHVPVAGQLRGLVLCMVCGWGFKLRLSGLAARAFTR